MDVKAITDFMDIVDNDNYIYSTGKKIIRNKINFLDWYDEFKKKQLAFETCVLNCCMEKQEGAIMLLSIYADRLTKRRKDNEDSFIFTSQVRKYMLQEDENHKVPIGYRYSFRFHSCLEKGVIKASDYLNNMIQLYDKQNNDSKQAKELGEVEETKKTETIFYATNHTNKKLRRVYKYLIENGHLEADTPLPDFLYYFTGKGKKANNRLKWIKKYRSKVNLAFFLIAVTGGDRSEECWKKAEIVFGETGLAQSYNQAPETSTSQRKISREVEKLLK